MISNASKLLEIAYPECASSKTSRSSEIFNRVPLPDKMTGSLENVSITPRTIWRFPTSKKTVPGVEFQTQIKTQHLRINCHDNTRCGPSKHFSTSCTHALNRCQSEKFCRQQKWFPMGVTLIRPLDHTSSSMLERLHETTVFVSNDIFNEDTIKANDTTHRGRYF